MIKNKRGKILYNAKFSNWTTLAKERTLNTAPSENKVKIFKILSREVHLKCYPRKTSINKKKRTTNFHFRCVFLLSSGIYPLWLKIWYCSFELTYFVANWIWSQRRVWPKSILTTPLCVGEARRGEARRAVRVFMKPVCYVKEIFNWSEFRKKRVYENSAVRSLMSVCRDLGPKENYPSYCCHEWPTHLIPLSRGLYFSLGWKVNKPCPIRGAKFVFSLWLHVKTVWFTRRSHEYSALIGLFYRKYIVIGPTPSTPSVLHDLHCWPKFNQHKTITKIPSLSIVLRVFTRII